ncbi:DUF998 domain-containing protein [Neptunicoccus sediminis]|uniref:DUF998 domain-containing protein n=1 Tax=Neptunicoccus sediminis TaxID=1892596 RepID=UPI000845CEE6|nr:DUF998 domain-containing protein [Neptunicoccus sediminis]
MSDEATTPQVHDQPRFLIGLGAFAIFGCAVLGLSILVADFVVPDHDWIADTISDLGAGKYEFIVDIGIYAFAAALIAIALLSAHVHLGGWGWSLGSAGFALLGLIVFLIGARNEYGDSDKDGVVIHIYLVYVLGALMTLIPLLMAKGAYRAGRFYGVMLIGVAVVWTISAPVFFFLPTGIDGIYERYLGLIAIVAVVTLARLFIARGRALSP